MSGEEKRTAEEWEKVWRPKGLMLHNHHGFGQGYAKSVDESYYTEPVTLKEFQGKVLYCTCLSLPAEWEKIQLFKIDWNGSGGLTLTLDETLEFIKNEIINAEEGVFEVGDSLTLTLVEMTQEEHNNMPEFEGF